MTPQDISKMAEEIFNAIKDDPNRFLSERMESKTLQDYMKITIQVVLEEYAALTSPASGWVKVESEKDLPQKFGMHVCICHIIEDGISYYPASYQQFDTIRNEWTNPQICGKPCKVIKYLSETPLPSVDELHSAWLDGKCAATAILPSVEECMEYAKWQDEGAEVDHECFLLTNSQLRELIQYAQTPKVD